MAGALVLTMMVEASSRKNTSLVTIQAQYMENLAIEWRCCVGRADIPASSPAGALPPGAADGGDDELDMVATASSLLPTSFDTVIVLKAGFWRFRVDWAALCGGTTGAS